MKQFLFIITIFFAVIFLWMQSDQWSFSKEKYIDQKVLELSMPFDVKIDTELLNSLKPAYEQ